MTPRISRAQLAKNGSKGFTQSVKEVFQGNHFYRSDTGKCASHHAQALASSSQRRAKKLRATPKWADKKAILSIYAEAKRIERETGIKMHVDHIVPLQGVNVTGLHTHTNLQIIPASENIKKSNKFQGAL